MKMLLFFLLVSIQISARTVSSYVYDINDIPIKNVEVKNVKTGKSVLSDSSGSFTIEGNDSDTIVFMYAGFVTTELTIKNILNSDNKVYLFNQLQLELPEVTVTPANMHELHEKAVYNLKNRLIKNKAMSYSCTKKDKEVNFGDTRELDFLFTANLRDVNPKKTRLNYEFLLSKLEVSLGTQTSKIMEDEKLYTDNLFFDYIRNKMPESKENSMQVLDSMIIIYNKSSYSDLVVCTINKSDTTLIKIEYELGADKKYGQRRTFKGKQIYKSYSAEFKKDNEGYYLHEKVVNYDYSFLIGKPEREERIVSSYKISVLPDPLPDANLKIKLDTRVLYNMGNYPVASD